jgi:hypothetical protein
MKLENSVFSVSGLPPSPIVDLRHPEERMAARLVERLDLTPPIDVEELCGSFAELSFKNFPIEIDGLCLDLKLAGKRPKVWVAKSIPPVRQRFTLAHEIGHIIIPSHTGTIIDDIDAPRSREKSKYREMEAQANSFAAELLMPSAWVTGLAERAEHVAGLMHSIREIAQVSSPAAFLKAGKLGRPGYVGAQVRDGVIIRSLRTPKTNSKPPEVNTQIDRVQMPAALEPRTVNASDALYYWWQIRETLDDPGNELPAWRAILEDILVEIPAEFRPKARASVNAIIGLAIGKESKGAPVNRIYRRGMEGAQNRESESIWVKHVLTHDRFKDYVLSRSRERANQPDRS